MSRWLKSVNTILEKLDDTVETVRDDAVARRFLVGQSDDDDEEDSNSYEDEEDEEEYYEDEDEYYDDEDAANDEQVTETVDTITEKNDTESIPDQQRNETSNEPSIHQNEGDDFADDGEEDEEDVNPNELFFTPQSTLKTAQSRKELRKTSMKDPLEQASPPSLVPQRITVTPKPPSAPLSSDSRSRKVPPLPRTNKKTNELQLVVQKNAQLQAQLDTAHAELEAQQRELEQAAQRMQQERERAEDDREDLIDEHEEVLQQTKHQYESEIQSLKETYEGQMQELRSQLERESHMRRQEGGDMTKELDDSIQRERDALQRASALDIEKQLLQSKMTKLETHAQALQSRIESLHDSCRAAEERERNAEESLDNALRTHQRQVAQRETRIAELEHTVAELSATMAASNSSATITSHLASNSVGERITEPVSYKKEYDIVAEELESTKTQLGLMTQRTVALETELKALSHEREIETTAAQERQQEMEEEISMLKDQINRLEGSLRESRQTDDFIEAAASKYPNEDTLRELETARKNIAALSDQLMRQQALSESSKSEILALRGRLQSATARANAAENALASAGSPHTEDQLYEIEGGNVTYDGSKTRRRIKTRRGRITATSGKSIRSAFGIRNVPGTRMDQIAMTIDAFDSWMMETGNILKQEPFVRAGFAVYLILLHFWCFFLVASHTIEAEHGDLGTLTGRQAIPDQSNNHG